MSSRKSILICVLAISTIPSIRVAYADTDAQIRKKIVQESVEDYLSTGHPCACPYNTARNGSSCGGRSAYSKPGGASPLCYPKDVTDEMVEAWKKDH